MKTDANTQNTLNIINRNAQRLLHLINQLLYFRRIETGKLKLNVSKGNLQVFLHGIFESFKDLAEHQKINYRFIETEINEETWFDAEKKWKMYSTTCSPMPLKTLRHPVPSR